MSTEVVKEFPESYYAILNASVEEFAEHGYTGVRMEHVAKRAGFNKSLIYRFFKNRESLFQAALNHQFTRREDLLGELPENFGDMLSSWSNKTQSDPVFMRMILREALEDTGDEPVASKARTEYYKKQIALLSEYQKQDKLPSDLKPEFLFIALLSIIVIPTALPQICRLATGSLPDSKDFQTGWHSFLGQFAEHLKDTGDSK